MKAGWEVKRLGEVCEVIGGGTPPKDNAQYFGGNIPWATVRDMNVELLEKTEHSITESGLAASSSKVIPAGEVVMASRVGLGKFCILANDTAINQDLRGLLPKSSKVVDRRYLFYWLKSKKQIIIDAGTGATVQGVKLPFIKGLEIPLPPLDEQKRIVAILDEAFEGLTRARAHTETNLQNARDLFEAFLSSFFESAADGWKTEKLENVVSHDCTLSYGIVQPGDEFEGGQFIVRPTDLGPRVISTDRLKRINPVLAASYSRTTLKGGELLLCVRGTTGTIAIASEALAGANVTRGIVPIRFDPTKVTQELGYYLFRSGAVQKQIEQATYGAALMQINIGDVRKLTVSYPPLEDQKLRISELVEAESTCDTLVSHYRAKLADLDALRQSLLQKAFAGELT